jgi:TolB-like protein
MQIAKKIGILLAILTFCGCSRAVTRVSIPVKIQSEIDISRYSNFAVLPFVSEKHTERNEELPPEVGEEIASILRRGLARQKRFEVVSTPETARLLTGETVGEEWLSDTKHLSQLGEYFEVKGIIVGSFRFYSDSRPRRYYGERYSIQRQRYVMDYQDYMQKTYLLSLRVMIIDVETEQIIWDEAYRRSTAEAHTIGSFIFSQASPQSNTVRELGKRAVSEFTRQISPHYENEDRYLVK